MRARDFGFLRSSRHGGSRRDQKLKCSVEVAGMLEREVDKNPIDWKIRAGHMRI
jgi:hypothetical protein